MAGDYSIGSSKWPGTSKLIEEMGELAQVLGKLLGNNGEAQHWDGTDLRERLVEELADVRAALMFFIYMNLMPEESNRSRDRAHVKLDRFNEWHEKGQ